MSDRTYSRWVEPIAEADHAARDELLTFVRKLKPEDWARPSGLGDWTLKDLLAHLAGDTGKSYQTILECVVKRQPVDPALLGDPDEQNKADVEERQDRTVGELILEIEAEADAIDLLLSKLTEKQEHLKQANIPMTLGDGLSAKPGGHFREHLKDFKRALADKGDRGSRGP